ncbi:MAG: YitT family protein [Lachnospiraceae bacterium]
MNFKKRAKVIGGVLLGNLILSFTVAGFILPHGLVMGGATGIGITLGHYVSVDLSLIILAANALLFILGAAVLGKQFAINTIISSLFYPLMLKVIRTIPGIDNLTDNTLLATIYAGMLLGLGIGIIVRVGSSTGGTDILALSINKWFHIPVAICMYGVDFIIIAFQTVFSTTEQILYGVLALLLTSLVLGRVTLFGQSQIQLFIISQSYEEIRESLLKTMHVGATMVKIETGLDKQEQAGVLCVIPNRKLYAVNSMIQKMDDKAFITISQINEVKGRGFSLERECK